MALKKRWGNAALAGAAGIGLLAWGAGLWSESKFGGLVLFLLGAGAIIYAAVGCYESSCPECGKPVSMDAAVDYAPCPHCRAYARVTAEGLARLDDDHIADSPRFAIPFKDGLILPDACCVCRNPATRRTTVGAKLEDRRGYKTVGEGLKKNALIGAGVIPTIEVRVDIPHCGEHGHDARIDMAEQEIVVLVRSYPYYRAAAGLS